MKTIQVTLISEQKRNNALLNGTYYETERYALPTSGKQHIVGEHKQLESILKGIHHHLIIR
jgi:hypothetical protein